MPTRRAMMDALITSALNGSPYPPPPPPPPDPEPTTENAAPPVIVAPTMPPLIQWIQSEFYIPERRLEQNPAMQLAPYQRAVLREANRRDKAGKFVYDTVIWSDLKKSIKSSIAAAVILYRALCTPYGSFKVVANDLKQADSRVFYYIKRAIDLNPNLRGGAFIQNYRNRIVLDNKAVIEAIPVDPKGEAGGNDDMIEWTELHAAKGTAHLSMWTEMTLSPTKHGYSQRWIDTYAGYRDESPLLQPLYDELVKPENLITLDDPDAQADLELYAQGRVLCLWNTKPRLKWQTEEYYASEAAALAPQEFKRIHRNEWGSSTEKFVPMEWWDACKRALPPMDKYRELAVTMDAAISGDCFGILAVSRHGDAIAPRYARIWTPPPHGKIDYEADDGPEAYIKWLCRDFNVVIVAYDEYQLHEMVTRLSNKNIAYFEKFSQDAPRAIADKQLYDMIRDRRVWHDGTLDDLTTHIRNANGKIEGKNKEVMRIVKRSENLKIDLAVCLSMAANKGLEYLSE